MVTPISREEPGRPGRAQLADVTNDVELFAVVGTSPGIGKSTLCAAVVREERGRGRSVDHFEEGDVLTRPAFRAVAEEFEGGERPVRPRTLVDGLAGYVHDVRAAGVDVVVADSLIPFIPSLVVWGHDEREITTIVADVAAVLATVDVRLVYLRGDPATALARAVKREGPDWACWYVAKLGAWPGTRSVHDLASAADHLRRETDLTLRVLSTTGWPTLVLDVDGRSADDVRLHVKAWRSGTLARGQAAP